MRSMILALALLLIPCTSGFAAELSAASKAEIDALLDRLGASGCEFNRNGTWYGSAKAKSHLARKLDYLLDRKLVESPEQFIELAGSRSSQSGEPYQVKCGNDPAVPSATWLTAQLKALRAGNAPPATPKWRIPASLGSNCTSAPRDRPIRANPVIQSSDVGPFRQAIRGPSRRARIRGAGDCAFARRA